MDRNLVTVVRKLAVVWLYGIAKLWFMIANLGVALLRRVFVVDDRSVSPHGV